MTIRAELSAEEVKEALLQALFEKAPMLRELPEPTISLPYDGGCFGHDPEGAIFYF